MKINTWQIMTTMAACMFGAGFISGQELWQFFGSFGTAGLVCMFAASVLLGILTFMTVHYASAHQTSEMDKIVIPTGNVVLVRITGAVELSFMFCIYIIMLAGAGTLIEDLTGSFTARIVFSFLFCFCVCAISFAGIGGAVKIFNLAVPVMVIVAIIIAAAVTLKSGFPSLNRPTPPAENPLIANPIISMLTFVSYNFFCAIGTFAFLGKHGVSGKRTMLGAAMGSIVLTAVAMLIIVAIFAVPGSEHAELPLLYLAGSIGTPLKYIVALTLLIAMFGASLSVFVPIPEYLGNIKRTATHAKSITIILAAAALTLSFLGFSDLISVIYPIYGYIALAAMVGVVINFIKTVTTKS